MQRLLSGLLVAGSCIAVAAAPVARETPWASGIGAFHYDDGESVGFFDFEVQAAAVPTGWFLYAAEDHHGYPEVVVRLHKLERVRVQGNSFTLTGKGALQEDPVSIWASGTDGAGKSPDSFAIKCYTAKDEVVYQAEGELFLGDIQVGGQ